MFGTGQHWRYRRGIFSPLALRPSALPDREHLAVYRFYIIPDDSTAIKQAEHMLDGFSVEL